MYDTIEKLDNSLIQHGPMNQRIYLMKLNGQDLPGLITKLDTLAEQKNYTKIFAKVPLQVKAMFANSGYTEEAKVPVFYHGEIDAVFLAKYLDPQRQSDSEQKQINSILELSHQKSKTKPIAISQDDLTIRLAQPEDAEAMAEVFKAVFETYPFPIHDPAYLRETMESHIQYYCVFDGSRMIAVSSAEMDASAGNVEMTDFATLNECRGKSLAQRLLNHMETEMAKKDIKTAYTIARALSPGMNITFARGSYQYGGTLTNNTNICGQLESMNVWYKPLSK